MSFLDAVVCGQVMAEFLTHVEELSNGHALWTFLCFACGVERIPRCAEMVVEVVHVLGHPIVLSKLMI